MPYLGGGVVTFFTQKSDEKCARALPLTRGGAFTPIKATPGPIQPLISFIAVKVIFARRKSRACG